MKNKVIISLTIFLSLSFLKVNLHAGVVTPAKGDLFPAISLTVPEKEGARIPRVDR